MGLFKFGIIMTFSPRWSPPVAGPRCTTPARSKGSVRSNITECSGRRLGSLSVFIVGEKVVEDSEGGFEVQVDDVWKTKK